MNHIPWRIRHYHRAVHGRGKHQSGGAAAGGGACRRGSNSSKSAPSARNWARTVSRRARSPVSWPLLWCWSSCSSATAWFGIFANIALIINVGLIFGLLSAIGATLTLPGIAGIVLTIGMAVDANVLVFERIRKRSRPPKGPARAIELGYEKALSAITGCQYHHLHHRADPLCHGLGSGAWLCHHPGAGDHHLGLSPRSS